MSFCNKIPQLYFYITFSVLVSSCSHQHLASLVGLKDENTSFAKVILKNEEKCSPFLAINESGKNAQFSAKTLKFDDVTVCETEFPKEIKFINKPDKIIEIPRVLNKIAIVGDTGCRLKNKEEGGKIQNCNNPDEWPFKTLAGSISNDNPDVVIHLGDYHYREICKDKEKCLPYLDTITYGFKGWNADFLKPAEKLLNERPFIFVRGNHEDCKRAYLGYYKLLSPENEAGCVLDEPTRYLKFGDLLIVNFDSSNIEDTPYAKNSSEFKNLQERFLEMINTINSRPEKDIWIITHKPIWAVTPFKTTIIPANLNLLNITKDFPLPKKVSLVLSGHVHNFQMSNGNHPTQLVVGVGGTELTIFPEFINKKVSDSGIEIFSPTIDKNQFGYVMLEKDSIGKWKAIFKNTNGIESFVCSLEKNNSQCDLK